MLSRIATYRDSVQFFPLASTEEQFTEYLNVATSFEDAKTRLIIVRMSSVQ